MRYRFPSKIAETIGIKEGDSLVLKIEGIRRGKVPSKENLKMSKDTTMLIAST